MRDSHAMNPKEVWRSLFMKSVLWGLIFATGLTLILLIVFTVVQVKQDVSPGTLSIMSYIIGCLGSFSSGFIASRKMRQNGLLMGVVAALTYALFVLLMGLLFFGNTLGVDTLLKVMLYLVLGAFGGIVGVNIRKRSK